MGLAFPVPTEACFAALSWTGVELSFVAGFRAQQTADVKVYSMDLATFVQTLLTEGVHYTVTLAGDGSVTVLPVALPAAPKTILILRDTPATQPTDFANLSTYTPAVHTELHSKAALRDAEDKLHRGRLLRAPLGESFAVDLPAATARASKVLAFDVAGNPVVQAAVSPATAAGISFTPGGGISATNVQAAIAELDTEAAKLAGLAPVALSGAVADLVGGMIDWAPTLTFATPGDLAVGYATRVGKYVKIGPVVFLHVNILTNLFTWTTAAGALQITGLPFANANVVGNLARGGLQWAGITKAGYTQAALGVGVNASLCSVNMSGSGVATAAAAAPDLPSGGTVQLVGEAFYFIA